MNDQKRLFAGFARREHRHGVGGSRIKSWIDMRRFRNSGRVALGMARRLAMER